jgi:hypothetical protein
MLKRANTPAKVKTTVRARVAARPATMVAKAKTLAKAREAAQLTEAKCLKHSDETGVLCQTGRSFQTPALVHQVRDWYSGVAIKIGRRQGVTKEHI